MKLPGFYDIDRLDQRRADLFDRLMPIMENTIMRYHRAEVSGLDRIPEGGALYVGNHNAGMYCPEMYILGTSVYRARGLADVPFGLTHEVALRMPPFNQIIVPLGGVRASHDNAMTLLGEGHKVLVYPGGDVDSFRPWRARNEVRFGGRKGYIRLALRAGVPIVPVVTAGAHQAIMILDDLPWLARALRLDKLARLKVLPLTLSVPFGLTVGPFVPCVPLPSRVLMEILPPLAFDRTGDEAAGDEGYVAQCAVEVEGMMQAALTRLAEARKRR